MTIKSLLTDLLTYLKLMSRKWILWLFALLDFMGLLTQILFPQIQIPISGFIIVAFIGFIWAGFQVYVDLVSELPSRPTPSPPYEVLPLSFEINLSQSIPNIDIWLYVSNHQRREVKIIDLAIDSFNLTGGPTLDVIHHSDEITVPKLHSERILCRRTLIDSESRTVRRIQKHSFANASYNVISRAAIGRRVIGQKFQGLHVNGRIIGIEQTE